LSVRDPPSVLMLLSSRRVPPATRVRSPPWPPALTAIGLPTVRVLACKVSAVPAARLRVRKAGGTVTVLLGASAKVSWLGSVKASVTRPPCSDRNGRRKEPARGPGRTVNRPPVGRVDRTLFWAS